MAVPATTPARAMIPATPHRRTRLITAERAMLRFQLHRWRWWRESGRTADRWLESGVARAIDYSRPVTKHHRPSGGYQPVAARDDDNHAWLRTMDEVIEALPPQARQVVWWKAADYGTPERLSLAAMAERLGCSEREVSDIWQAAALELVNALWPGASGGFALGPR